MEGNGGAGPSIVFSEFEEDDGKNHSSDARVGMMPPPPPLPFNHHQHPPSTPYLGTVPSTPLHNYRAHAFGSPNNGHNNSHHSSILTVPSFWHHPQQQPHQQPQQQQQYWSFENSLSAPAPSVGSLPPMTPSTAGPPFNQTLNSMSSPAMGVMGGQLNYAITDAADDGDEDDEEDDDEEDNDDEPASLPSDVSEPVKEEKVGAKTKGRPATKKMAEKKALKQARAEGKRKDECAAHQRIDQVCNELAQSLKRAISQVIYYPLTPAPTSSMSMASSSSSSSSAAAAAAASSSVGLVVGGGGGGGGGEGREWLKPHLPVGVLSAYDVLKKLRDPHIHYAFFESEFLQIQSVIKQHNAKVQELQKYLRTRVNHFKNRLMNNRKKKYTGGPIDLSKAPLTPFQQENQHLMTDDAVVHVKPQRTVIAPPVPITTNWNAVAGIVPAVTRKDGSIDPHLCRIEFKRIIRPPKRRKRKSTDTNPSTTPSTISTTSTQTPVVEKPLEKPVEKPTLGKPRSKKSKS
jgi:hypothetical protein